MIWEIDEATRRIEGLDEHGRARPEYAASLGLIPAPFGRRALAATIELAVYLVLQLPMLLGVLPALLAIAAAPAQPLSGGELVVVVICAVASGVLTTAYVITQLALHGRRGVTLGKAITGLRSVNVRTLERPGFWRGAVVRGLVLWASLAVPLVGPLLVIALSPFFDGERRGRGWPDLAAATWLVDAREGLNPYDAKRMRIARKTVATDLADVRSELPSLATPVGEGAGKAYIPTTRSSGGVIGAVRSETPVDDGGAGSPAAGAVAAPAAQPPVGGVPSWGAPAPTSALPHASVPAPAPVAPTSAPAAGAGWVPPRLIPDAEPVVSAAEPVAAAPSGRPQPVAPSAVEPPAAAGPRRQQQAAPPPGGGPGDADAFATLTLDDGVVIAVRGSGILLGRDPAPSPTAPRLAPIAIADPSMSVSKTHLAILRTDAGAVVIDLGSTNGSAIVRDGAEHTLAPREQTALRTGDTIRLGDRHARFRIG